MFFVRSFDYALFDKKEKGGEKMKKLLAIFLAVIMLLSLVLMTSCDLEDILGNKDQEDEKDDDTNQTPTEDNGGSNEGAGNTQIKYDGAVVTVLGSAREYYAGEIYATENSTNTVEAATYNRNKAVEKKLDVELNVINEATSISDVSRINTMIRNDVFSGKNDFDIVMGTVYLTVASVYDGYMRNLTACEQLNLNADYWSDEFNKVLSYRTDKQYLAVGDANLSLYRGLHCTIFDKDAFSLLNGERSLYDVVDKGEWTMEYQLNASRRLSAGLSSSGNTVYGMAGGLKASIDPYWASLDTPLILKTSNNTFDYVGDERTYSSKLESAVDDIIELYIDSSCYVGAYEEDSFTDIPTAHEMFYGRRAVMATTAIYHIERTTSQLDIINYGIVPMPMATMLQGAYYTGMSDQVSCFGIIKTVSDDRFQMVGHVVDCINAESADTTVKAYKDSVLDTILKDDASKRMFNIMCNGVYMPLASAYTGVVDDNVGAGITTLLRNIVTNGVVSMGMNPTSSTLSNIKAPLNTNVSALNSNFENLR